MAHGTQGTWHMAHGTRQIAEGTGYRTQGRGHKVHGAGHRVQGTRHRVQGAGRRAKTGCRAEGRGYGAHGAGYRAQSAVTGHRAHGTGTVLVGGAIMLATTELHAWASRAHGAWHRVQCTLLLDCMHGQAGHAQLCLD